MALISAVAGTLADQFKEYIYCDSLSADVLAARGKKKGYQGFAGVISDGSTIAIADGQCMMIVDQGQIIDICAQTGEYTYDMSSEPSIFTGNLSEGVFKMAETIIKRFTYGGVPASEQRCYFFNTKEITGNKYGTPNAVPFRVVDQRAGIDIDISVRCFGEYSYKITNPLLFYQNICGNMKDEYLREELDSQLKTELLTALQPAFAQLSAKGIRYSEVPAHTIELADSLNEQLSAKWKDLRGIEIVSFGVSSITASPEDEEMLKQLQKNAAFVDPTLAAANLAGAQAQAMMDAAKNPNGAAAAFMGMNMAQNAGGVNANELYAAAQGPVWFCPNCGNKCNGNFCSKCGTAKPAE